jgi:hypothetical protein
VAATKTKTETTDTVIARLEDGYYDRELARWQAVIDEATAELRRAHAAMKAENKLVS